MLPPADDSISLSPRSNGGEQIEWEDAFNSISSLFEASAYVLPPCPNAAKPFHPA